MPGRDGTNVTTLGNRLMLRNPLIQDITVATGAVAGAVLLALALRSWSEDRLGALPVGSDLVLWAYIAAASVAAVTLGIWVRAYRVRGFAVGLLAAYAAALIAGALTLVVSLALFYGSGAYEKGGYGQLAAALIILLATLSLGLAIAARLVLGRGSGVLWRVGALVGWILLVFVASLVLLPFVLV